MARKLPTLLAVALGCCVGFAKAQDASKYQYEFEKLQVPLARVDEPKRETFDPALAAQHLERGSEAWSRRRQCVSCHTNGTYLLTRPALSEQLGVPDKEHRAFALARLDILRKMTKQAQEAGTRPAEVIYIAAGLAEWDARIGKQLSTETDDALRYMFTLQLPSGTWGSLDCWPPLESSAFHLATVAMMGAMTAPGWLERAPATWERWALGENEIGKRLEALYRFLRTTKPTQDYDALLLLWASTRTPFLLEPERRDELIAMARKHQREDGGWSIRTFSTPEAWGGGNRAKKLREEPEFAMPPSDGHQTGLAVLVLRDAGVPADDPAVKRGVEWLLKNQRESGRWWTRSLNTDRYHFITYSGTCYPLLALAKCGVPLK